jgi:hypothetical protein
MGILFVYGSPNSKGRQAEARAVLVGSRGVDEEPRTILIGPRGVAEEVQFGFNRLPTTPLLKGMPPVRWKTPPNS